MNPEKFSTHALPRSEQLDAWRGWYGSVFETSSPSSPRNGFRATNLTWALGGLAFSRVSAPAISVVRTKSLIRRNPVDHWAVTLSKHSATELRTRDTELRAPTRVPFVLSLGEEMQNARGEDEHLQLYLARDSFSAIASLLDAANGTVLGTPQGALFADYMLMLERHLPDLPAEDAQRLVPTVEAMLSACLAPSADRIEGARPQINLTLMERVRQAVRRHLHSSSLGPDKLCQEAATSRSQLYRLLEGEGGVAHYIQRRRLLESFAILCDVTSLSPIGTIAEVLCFADASSFSRAFRREFGISPRDVREAALAGLAPPATPSPAGGSSLQSFSDCLRSF